MTHSEIYGGPLYVKGESAYAWLPKSAINKFQDASLEEMTLFGEVIAPRNRVEWYEMIEAIATRLDECDQTSEEYLDLLEAYYTIGGYISAEAYEHQERIGQEQQAARRQQAALQEQLSENDNTLIERAKRVLSETDEN